jgi:hypothetical protein
VGNVSGSAKQRLVVAILTTDCDQREFRGNRLNFADLIRTGEEMGVFVYVTTPRYLKMNQPRTVGYRYDTKNKSWHMGQFPFPRIIYNRVPYRKHEMRPEVQETLQACIRNKSIKMFNPSFFNKWTLFEWLSRAKTTKKFIPVTRKLNSSDELLNLLKTHPTLYLKPEKGKAGKGIMKIQMITSRPKISSAPTREYWLTIQEKKSSQTNKFTSLSAIWASIQQFIHDKDYIVQQGIPLSNYKKRPYDLRVLAQKNAKGLWEITGVGARVAGKSSITTHVPRGGSIDDPEKLLTSAFGNEGGRKLLVRVRKSALAIARQIERKSGHALGEMSMDLGIDTTGGIWFFEANAKPMKFDEPHIRKKSLERIIQYCMYLNKKKAKSSA